MKKYFAFLLVTVLLCLCSTALAVSWGSLMSQMDWTSPDCSYAVNGTAVSRVGKNVHISGGKISDLRFVNKSMWGDDWQAQFGWHTESGTYTFENVAVDMEGDVEVWAHLGDQYKIVLEDSVTGQFGMNFTLGQGAEVELVNNTVLQSNYDFDTLNVNTDEDCAFRLSGTGKVYPPETATTWDLDCSRNMHMTVGFGALADNDEDAVQKFIAMLEDVHIDKAQFVGDEPQIYIWYGRYGENLEGFDMLLQETDVNSLSIGETALQIAVSSAADHGAAKMKSMVYPEDDQAMCFGELLNDLQESWWLQGNAELYIPYPDGIDESTAEYYRFWIDYPSLFGDEKSLASDDSIEFTPYGLKITIRELLPFVLNWEEIRDPGEVTWQEVVSGVDLSQKAPSLKVAKEDGHFIIDGGNATTISDVKIDCMDPQSTMGNGTYVLRNVKLKYDMELFSANRNALGLELESSVRMNGRVSLEADASGDIIARIACDTRSIGLLPSENSFIRLENTGTTGNIGMECCDQSRAEIVNDSPLTGPVFQLDDHCTADITLNGDIGYLISWLWGGSNATYISNGDVIRLMNLEANSGSHLTFINNSVILNDKDDPVHWDGNEWSDFQLKLAVDAQSALTFGGSGSIMPGTQMYDYYTGSLCGPIDGASVVFDTVIPEVSGDHAANRQMVYDVAQNIAFDWTQVKKHPGAEKVIAVRRDEESPEYTYVIDMLEPLTEPDNAENGSLVAGEGALDALAPVEVPTLVLPDGAVTDASAKLIYDANTNGKGRIVYQVRIMDESGEAALPEGSILCFPYPEGLNAESGRKYNILIRHLGKTGTEVFKTDDGGVELRKQGLCIRVSSLSPFEITWKEKTSTLFLPAKLERIENDAFAGCEALERVVIPPSVTFIGEKAFAQCPDVLLIVPYGSYAQSYAEEHGIEYAYPGGVL